MNADRIARIYQWLEYAAFGGLLQKCRTQFLDRCAGAQRALVIGDGDGRFTAELVRRYPGLAVESVDASAEMIRLAARRIGGAAKLLHADARRMEPAGSFDLVATHFFLDCLTQTEADALIRRLARHLHPGALWIVSEFHIPSAGWRRMRARAWIATMYRFFRFTTGLQVHEIPDYEAAFAAAGLTMLEEREQSQGMLRCTLWRLTGDRSSGQRQSRRER